MVLLEPEAVFIGDSKTMTFDLELGWLIEKVCYLSVEYVSKSVRKRGERAEMRYTPWVAHWQKPSD